MLWISSSSIECTLRSKSLSKIESALRKNELYYTHTQIIIITIIIFLLTAMQML